MPRARWRRVPPNDETDDSPADGMKIIPIALQEVQVASWQTFPFGTLLTLATVLSTLGLGALLNHLSKIFFSVKEADALGDSLRKETNAMGDSLREKIAEMQEDQKALLEQCRTTLRIAEEASRIAELAMRSQGEQWARISEELIRPIRQMSAEIKQTRETLVAYVTTQDAHTKEFERLEKRLGRVEDRNNRSPGSQRP